MNERHHTILETIDSQSSATHPYVSSRHITESLDGDLDDIEQQLRIMEENGLVRLARTQESSGEWDARLTPKGRRAIGKADFPGGGGADAGQGNAAAISKEQIGAVEAITANVEALGQAGERRIGDALMELTTSLTASRSLGEEEQEKALSQLRWLSEQACAGRGGQSREELSHSLAALKQRFLGSEPLARIWAVWEPILADFFNL